jgi:transmembrane sensor
LDEKSFRMANLQDKIAQLLEKSEWTEKEKQWMLRYLEETDSEELHEIMKAQFEDKVNETEALGEEISNKVLQKIHEQIGVEKKKNKTAGVRFWMIEVAAASVIVFIALTVIKHLKTGTKSEVAKTAIKKDRDENRFLAPANKAVLTLADGSAIMLDETANGALPTQGSTKVLKQNRKLAYNVTGGNSNQVLYNTIRTGAGGNYQVMLSDGSKVWLNDLSSLHFPTVFIGKERRVEVTGEAYFEVAKNKTMPFIVKVNGAEVQVLGTQFNIMAYNDEAALETTLLEGQVKFVSGGTNSLLKPGQQSQLAKNGRVKVISGVDVAEVMAWKNGLFDFKGADIELLTRQLSRYYDVEIVHDKKIKDLFYAQFPRSTNLSDVLKALELTGKVRFAIEGKRVIVTQ